MQIRNDSLGFPHFDISFSRKCRCNEYYQLTFVTRVTRITRKLHRSAMRTYFFMKSVIPCHAKVSSCQSSFTGKFTGFLIEHFDFILKHLSAGALLFSAVRILAGSLFSQGQTNIYP